MISIPVSIGELIDKLSILQVKLNKVSNSEKLHYIRKEFDLLYEKSEEILKNEQIKKLFDDLVKVNTNLWEIEDDIRYYEKLQNFGEQFIELARLVYITNDRRFELKNQINQLTESEIKEIKEYIKY